MKTSRHLHHDYQPIDEVSIRTIPRYKTSGFSGDEWRIIAIIEYKRKGRIVESRLTRNVETALRYADAWLMEFLEKGNYSAGRQFDDCDQEGCTEKATHTMKLKNRFTRSEGIKHPYPPENLIVRFCDKHRQRGDCGREDNDRNYIEVKLDNEGNIES